MWGVNEKKPGQQFRDYRTKPLTLPDKHYFERSDEDAGLSSVELRQKYGKSVFYDCLDASPSTTTTEGVTTEKQDDMKPDTETNTEEDCESIN